MVSLISITKTVCTSSGNYSYIPALSFRLKTIINMTIPDRSMKRSHLILHPKLLSNEEVLIFENYCSAYSAIPWKGNASHQLQCM